MKRAILLFSLLLAGCNSGGGSSPPTSPIAGWPAPAPGQWSSGLYAQVVTPNLGTSFAIPGGNGLHYVYTPAPANLKTASTMTLTYTISGNATFGINDPHDSPPPQIDLFIWQAGDNLSCEGSYVNDRQFSNARSPVANGTYTLTVPLTQSAWHNCLGNSPNAATPDLAQAIHSAAYVGFALGGADFDGHGVYVSSGSATFTINSFSVQ